VLYRGHAQSRQARGSAQSAQVPFVIKNLSIFPIPGPGVIAYLRLISSALGRCLLRARAGHAGVGLDASDLVRLAERKAKSKGASLWDTLQISAKRTSLL